MKDNSIRHYDDLDGSKLLEVYKDEEKIISLRWTTIDVYQGFQELKFTKESIQEIINDLNQIISE